MYNEINKKLSCGVLVVDSSKNLLMLHVTGQNFWDIPKGTQEEAEVPVATALREMKEESGILASQEDLVEIGWCQYNMYKDLWLFILYVDTVDLSKLKCRSTFTDEKLRIEMPEIDDYKLIPLEDASSHMCGSLNRLFDNELHNDILRNFKEKKAKINYE